MTVCNQNQVEASFLKDLDMYGNTEMVKLLFDEFINGHQRNLSLSEKQLLNNVLSNISVGHKSSIPPSFLSKSSQSCKDLFISINFRQMNLTSTRIPEENYIQLVTLGPGHFSTDFGSCCTFIPYLHLKPFDTRSVKEVYHDLKSEALNGETHGMNFLLDAEQFNYAYYDTNSAGFKISLHNHLDKPMIQFSSQLIFTGRDNSSKSWITLHS